MGTEPITVTQSPEPVSTCSFSLQSCCQLFSAFPGCSSLLFIALASRALQRGAHVKCHPLTPEVSWLLPGVWEQHGVCLGRIIPSQISAPPPSPLLPLPAALSAPTVLITAD